MSELLLQSVGDILRVFPAWPAEKAARFAKPPCAEGGFLVRAEQQAGKVAIGNRLDRRWQVAVA